MAQITENPAHVGARNRAGNNLSTRQRFRHWPGEGPTGAFAFGLARGVVEGILADAGLPVTFVTPPAWKRVVGLTLASKDASRAEAIRRVPARAELFVRVKDDGRAEACLIDAAGLMRKGGAP